MNLEKEEKTHPLHAALSLSPSSTHTHPFDFADSLSWKKRKIFHVCVYHPIKEFRRGGEREGEANRDRTSDGSPRAPASLSLLSLPLSPLLIFPIAEARHAPPNPKKQTHGTLPPHILREIKQLNLRGEFGIQKTGARNTREHPPPSFLHVRYAIRRSLTCTGFSERERERKKDALCIPTSPTR